jgi:hypothetical protein
MKNIDEPFSDGLLIRQIKKKESLLEFAGTGQCNEGKNL